MRVLQTIAFSYERYLLFVFLSAGDFLVELFRNKR